MNFPASRKIKGERYGHSSVSFQSCTITLLQQHRSLINMPTTASHAVPESVKGKSIFLTGATGYVGGSVLTKLLLLPVIPSTITLLVRDAKKAEGFEKLSTPSGATVKVLVGALEETDKLTQAAADADIIFSCANADDMPSSKALLAGAKQRKSKTGHRLLWIQTSGTGQFIDDARGPYPNDKVSGVRPTYRFKVMKCAGVIFVQVCTDLNPHPGHRQVTCDYCH